MFYIVTLFLFSSIACIFAAVYQVCFNKNDMT